MDINYEFFLHYITHLPNAEHLRVLDYGCGNGEVVTLLRDAGIDCYGVDTFYEGGAGTPKDELCKSDFILEVPPVGDLPFPPGYFDVVVSNMVFEHVEDLDQVLIRLDKVLKDKGMLYVHFPVKETILEGHIGLPLVHWFPRNQLRYTYTRFLRSLGLGFFKGKESAARWTTEKLEWIDKYCFYRTNQEVKRALSGYEFRHNELQYVRFRGSRHPILKYVVNIGLFAGIYTRLFRRLAFTALEIRKGSHA